MYLPTPICMCSGMQHANSYYFHVYENPYLDTNINTINYTWGISAHFQTYKIDLYGKDTNSNTYSGNMSFQFDVQEAIPQILCQYKGQIPIMSAVHPAISNIYHWPDMRTHRKIKSNQVFSSFHPSKALKTLRRRGYRVSENMRKNPMKEREQ